MCPLGEQIWSELEILGYEVAFQQAGFIQTRYHTGEEVVSSNTEARQKEKAESRLVNPNMHVLHKQLPEKTSLWNSFFSSPEEQLIAVKITRNSEVVKSGFLKNH